jgi:hypothetical protein
LRQIRPPIANPAKIAVHLILPAVRKNRGAFLDVDDSTTARENADIAHLNCVGLALFAPLSPAIPHGRDRLIKT